MYLREGTQTLCGLLAIGCSRVACNNHGSGVVPALERSRHLSAFSDSVELLHC